jgi:hypothetical protein
MGWISESESILDRRTGFAGRGKGEGGRGIFDVGFWI